MSNPHPVGRPRILSERDLETIYTRYQLWNYNRPVDIAAAYGISLTYVTMIGRARTRRQQMEDPCPPHKLKNPLLGSRSTLIPAMSPGPSATGATAGLARSVRSSERNAEDL